MERKKTLLVSSVCLRLCSAHTQCWRAAKSRPLLCNTASLLPHSLGSNSWPVAVWLVLFFFNSSSSLYFLFLAGEKKKMFLFFSAVVGHPYGNGFKSQVVGALANQIQWLWWNELCWIHIYTAWRIYTPPTDSLSLSLAHLYKFSFYVPFFEGVLQLLPFVNPSRGILAFASPAGKERPISLPDGCAPPFHGQPSSCIAPALTVYVRAYTSSI